VANVYRDVVERARNGIARPGPDHSYADGDDSTWMSIDWPAISRDIEIDGHSVHVVDSGGDKPPLLFIHGLGGVWQNWLLNLPAFMDTHRVVAFDLPGFGQSEMASEESIPAFARTADTLCAELRIDCPVVIGNSMGGSSGPSSPCRSLRASRSSCSCPPRACRPSTSHASRSSPPPACGPG
jgi:alpha/beta hydrolase fold